MLNNSNKYSYDKILIALFCFVFLQQVFILNFGGSLKIYEILGILLIFVCIKQNEKYITTQLMYLFFFFCISPIISDIFFLLFADTSDYYYRFPDARYSLRTNEIFTIIYMLLLCLFNYCIANLIITSEFVYVNRNKIIKIFIITGTCISIYNLYAFFGVGILGLPDIIPSFLEHRNSPPAKGFLRVAGFSDEPGSYIVIQTPCLYYLIFYRKIFKKEMEFVLLLINGISILLTLSSSLLITFSGLVFYMLFLSPYRIDRLRICLLSIFLLFLFLIVDSNTNGLMTYYFITKIKNFIAKPNNTLDSGAMRAYTSLLGIEVFKENPLFGCGVGCSNYFLYKYEYSLGITSWGERLGKLIYPMNNHAKILAEQGLFGYFFFLLFFISTFFIFIKNRHELFIKVHLVILVSMFLFFMIIQPSTNLYMWLNIYLGLNSIYFMKEK
jgi:hypothetical protein